MITIKLKQLAKYWGRNISDIAQETGINRNTITALYHNRVDGIKFSTIQKICDTYKISLSELITYEPTAPAITTDNRKAYKQEGEIVPFTCWPWMLATMLPTAERPHTEHGFGKLEVYFKKLQGSAYWDFEALHDLASFLYQRYGSKDELDRFYQSFEGAANALDELYFNADGQAIINFSNDSLKKYFVEVQQTYLRFWQYSIFLDAFESGFDQEEIGRIAQQHHLSLDEVGILTTPAAMTYNDERRLALLEQVSEFKKKIGKNSYTDNSLMSFIADDEGIANYKQKFDFYNSRYSRIEHLSDKDIFNEMKRYLDNDTLYQSDLALLKSIEPHHEKKIAAILKKHRLNVNPLYFFQKLTYWREYRRKTSNLRGIHVLDMVLAALESKTGIPKEYLFYLSFDEFDAVLKRLITKEVLERRFNQGILVSIENGDYIILNDLEASSLRNELERRVSGESLGQITILGQSASPGYARGIARIVKGVEDLKKVKPGDILVAHVTNSEFDKVMGIAAATITEEGGIRSHATIKAHELGKPCIVGAKVAMREIRDGELVEVRANHGTVRVITRE